MVRSQLRWKVDILGFPEMYNSPYVARDLMAQTGVQIQLKIPSVKRRNWHKNGVKRPNWHKSWRLTPREVSTRKCFNAQPKHTPSGPKSGFLCHLLIFVNPRLLVLYK